ncbi:MAG: hypothetical protein KKA79_03175, partial [Nanoarchaeota archaeon]|nr:hypothetical protein [Nanoarchaeota archaeon]
MKFPKSFRKENLDYKIDKLLKEDNKGKTDYDPKAVQQLFMSINDYLGEVFDPKSDMAFIRWRMMAVMEKGFISELSYTEKDLQKFCRSIKITNQRNDMYLGIYVSYLANRIIPN